MERLEHHKDWRKFLDDNFDVLRDSLNLTNTVIHHLRREHVISEDECQTLVGINEAEKLKRADAFLNILRTDVAGVRFRQMVSVLQVRAYRCFLAAKLFRDFVKNQYELDTSGWILEVEDSEGGSSSAVFEKPTQMPINSNVEFVGSFNFDASLPSDHLPRSTEINKIQIKLNDDTCNGNVARPKIAIVSGIGGIGKSTLTRLFALDLQIKAEVDNVVWIPATSNDANVSTFARLAKTEFGIESYSADDENTPLTPDRFLPQLYRNLFQGRTLIIFDNAEGLSEEELQQFIPSSITPGQQWRPLILITSRPNDWESLNNNVLDLGYLKDQDAADYVMSRLGLYCPNRQEAQNLAKFYGNLIIALEAATAAIIQTNRERENGVQPNLYTVTNHLKEVEARQVLLHTSSTGGIIAKVKSLFWKTTPLFTIELGPEYKQLESLWSMSFDKVKNENQGCLALEVLDLCSWLDVDEIPVRLLELIWPPSETQLLAVIQLLKDYSLLTSFETSGSNPRKRLRLHRVLQKIRWKCLESPEALIEIVEKVLETADSYPPYLDTRLDPDARSMYRCLEQVVPTLEVFAKSEKVLQYLLNAIDELQYRTDRFRNEKQIPKTLRRYQIPAGNELSALKCEYILALSASQEASNRDQLDSVISGIVHKVSTLKSSSSAEDAEKQVLRTKLELLRYRILEDIPHGNVLANFCRASQRLSELSSAATSYWAIYECGKALVKLFGTKSELRNVYVIWNELKKHGIGKRTDPVTASYFSEVQTSVMLMNLCEGKLDAALETLDDKISGLQLDFVVLMCKKAVLANLLAFVGDYDSSLQLFHQAHEIYQINTFQSTGYYHIPIFLTFANCIPEAKYFQQVTDEFLKMCAPEERQKFMYGQMDDKWLDLVRQILEPETDDNVRKNVQNENTFNSARQYLAEAATRTNTKWRLDLVYDKFRKYHQNKDLATATANLRSALSEVSNVFGFTSDETLAFQYKLGIVLRDQWTCTGESCLLEEALEIFFSLVTWFGSFNKDDHNTRNPFNTFMHKCCHALGTILFYTADFNLAIQVLYTVWTHRRVIRGEAHTRTFESKLWYGKTLNKLGRRSEAVQVLEEVVRDVGSKSEKRVKIFQEAKNLLSTLKV